MIGAAVWATQLPVALSNTRRQELAMELLWRLAYVTSHFIEMGRPSSAATAEDVDVRIAPGQRSDAPTEVNVGAVLDMAGVAQVDFVVRAGI
ncbi:hypothetical protein ATE59_01180 [Sphingopyxis sp. A083]|nr:hypothetical protein ATE59_01180 [Sphingopyxis sp. A083]